MSEALNERSFRGPDGTQFAYLEAGSGPPIVLLHGWSSSLRWWNRNIEALAASHRVLALDFRGHGDSEKTPSGHTMETYARDVHTFVEQLNANGALMVGWSMGSIVLWNYVMQFGAGQARAMVFVGQSASDLTSPSYPHGIMNERDLHQWMLDLQGNRREMVTNNMKLMVKHPPTEEELLWMTEDYLRCPAHISTVTLYHQTMVDSFPAFEQINFPTQVYFGVDPKMYRLEHGEFLAGQIRDCELVVFEESGHVPMWEEPDRSNRELDAFGRQVFDEGQ